MPFTINTDVDCEDCQLEIRRLNIMLDLMSDDREIDITIVRDSRDLDQYHICGSRWRR